MEGETACGCGGSFLSSNENTFTLARPEEKQNLLHFFSATERLHLLLSTVRNLPTQNSNSLKNPLLFPFVLLNGHEHFLLSFPPMPLLTTFPHFPSLSLPPNMLRSSRTSCRCPSFGAKMTAADTNGAAILWFKHDLRIDDHPGLVAASKYRSLVPLYVFDHRILSREFHIHVYIYLIVWLVVPLDVGLEVEVE